MEPRNSRDYDKQQWQEQQSVRDAAWEIQHEKEAKARERSARNAKRKLERLHAKLKETGELTEWEGEFAESVTERLDEFGSAFADLQKGRPGDALSFAQKRVVASLNKKVKDARKARKAKAMGLDKGEGEDEASERPAYKPRRSFKSKKPKFTPRVRNLEDEMFEDEKDIPKREPYIPQYRPDVGKRPVAKKPVLRAVASPKEEESNRPPVGRPFLRIVG